MSAPAAAAPECAICGKLFRSIAETELIRDHRRYNGDLRCSDYAGCMVRAAQARRRSDAGGTAEASHAV